MKIGHEGEGEATEKIGKGAVRVNTIATDAQNLGVELFELRQVFLKRVELGASSVGEVERVKGQHDRFAAQRRECQG
jgi:hypothetical protein